MAVRVLCLVEAAESPVQDQAGRERLSRDRGDEERVDRSIRRTLRRQLIRQQDPRARVGRRDRSSECEVVHRDRPLDRRRSGPAGDDERRRVPRDPRRVRESERRSAGWDRDEEELEVSPGRPASGGGLDDPGARCRSQRVLRPWTRWRWAGGVRRRGSLRRRDRPVRRADYGVDSLPRYAFV